VAARSPSTFAVQLAKAFGAEVTGVCSGRHVELVRSIRRRSLELWASHRSPEERRDAHAPPREGRATTDVRGLPPFT